MANVPQRTYAILSRYDTVPTFVEYASGVNLEIRRYEAVQSFTSDLLDTFLDYKTNLLLINDVIKQPSKYQPADHPKAVAVEIKDLVQARNDAKREMRNIVDMIHKM